MKKIFGLLSPIMLFACLNNPTPSDPKQPEIQPTTAFITLTVVDTIALPGIEVDGPGGRWIIVNSVSAKGNWVRDTVYESGGNITRSVAHQLRFRDSTWNELLSDLEGLRANQGKTVDMRTWDDAAMRFTTLCPAVSGYPPPNANTVLVSIGDSAQAFTLDNTCLGYDETFSKSYQGILQLLEYSRP